jgi:dihydrofolate reductase
VIQRMIAVVAVDEGGGIGYRDGLPWPGNDLDKIYWKSIALSCGQLVLGSSMAMKKPPRLGIKNWTITSSPEKALALTASGYRVVSSLEELMARCRGNLAVLGGERIYKDLVPLCDAIAVTRMPGVNPSDAKLLIDPATQPYFKLSHVANAQSGSATMKIEWWKNTKQKLSMIRSSSTYGAAPS